MATLEKMGKRLEELELGPPLKSIIPRLLLESLYMTPAQDRRPLTDTDRQWGEDCTAVPVVAALIMLTATFCLQQQIPSLQKPPA